MKIDPQWIALADEFPEHDTHCIIGNMNEIDHGNSFLGTMWRLAVFTDRQKRSDESRASAEAAGHPLMMEVPLKGPRFVFEMFNSFSYCDFKEVTEFTHWWPIPKPFTEHPK